MEKKTKRLSQSSKKISVSKIKMDANDTDSSSNEESFKPTQQELDNQEREEIMNDSATKKEIGATKTRRLSASSTGSLPPCSEYNPFVKAQG